MAQIWDNIFCLSEHSFIFSFLNILLQSRLTFLHLGTFIFLSLSLSLSLSFKIGSSNLSSFI